MKWTSNCTASNRLDNRRINLHKRPVDKELAKILDNCRSSSDNIYCLRVREELNMSGIRRVLLSLGINRNIMQTGRQQLRQFSRQERKLASFSPVRITRYGYRISFSLSRILRTAGETYRRHRHAEASGRTA